MKFIELFAGIGGFRLGLERSGHKCVYTNEWLEKPASIYEKQFGDRPDTRDIRVIQGKDLPKADLICGGFPCATFSIAGKRTGFGTEDTRGTLFFEICRLLRETRTPYVFLENVKGLLNHDNGRTFAIMLASLDELGYDCQWELLDSQNFGIPQHRERIFIIGHLRGEPRPKVFPIGKTGGKNDEKDRREQKTREGFFSNISPTLDAHYSKGGASRQYVAQYRRGHFRDYKSEGSPTLTANMGTGGHNVPFVKMTMRSHTMANMKEKTQDRKSSWTLDTAPQNKMAVHTDLGIRKLTPLECERLQGLPDNFTKYYANGNLVSDSERYERCGRTVTIPVIKAIGEKLYV